MLLLLALSMAARPLRSLVGRLRGDSDPHGAGLLANIAGLLFCATAITLALWALPQDLKAAWRIHQSLSPEEQRAINALQLCLLPLLFLSQCASAAVRYARSKSRFLEAGGRPAVRSHDRPE